MLVRRLNQKSTSSAVNSGLLATPRFRTRTYHPHITPQSLNSWKYVLGITGTLATFYYFTSDASAEATVDYDQVRKDIVAVLDDPKWDDGSWGPVFVRLAWHASGTYDKVSKTGGSDGSTMRYEPESGHGANAGLAYARERLEEVKKKHPGITYADLWSLAGAVAVEHLGGPKIKWRPGRSDKDDKKHCTPDGRLPDASQGANHLRNIFYRMGFNDREIVALAGAHALGRCHRDRSGFEGPWTHSPTVFSNDFYEQLLENKWTKKNWQGPLQYEDPSGKLMMLPADLSLVEDPEFKKYVELYAKDEQLFFKDFAAAFEKLEELGVPFKSGGVFGYLKSLIGF